MLAQQIVGVVPHQRRHIQKHLGLRRRVRQHRLKITYQQPERLDAGAAHGLQFGGGRVGLGDSPRLPVVDVLVGFVRQRHDEAHRLAVFPRLVVLGHGLFRLLHLLQQGRVVRLRGEAAAETLADESGATAGDVHHLAHQIHIHPLHEVVEVEVKVVYAR